MSQTGPASDGADDPEIVDQTVSCPSCNKVYRWKNELANRTARCKGCGALMKFPAQPVVTASLVEPAPPAEKTLQKSPTVILPSRPAQTERDEGMYDIRVEPPALPKPVAPVSNPSWPGSSANVGGVVNYSGMSRNTGGQTGRGIMLRSDGESGGAFACRIIAIFLNGLLTASGLLCLLVCNPCGLATGVILGGINLYWILGADFDGSKRILSIVVNSVGILFGGFLISAFVLIDHLPIQVYTDIPTDARTLLKMIYVPLGSLTVIACASALVHAGVRSTDA